jgi:hypothetical protein
LFIVDNSLDVLFLFTVCYSKIEAFAKLLWDNWSSFVYSCVYAHALGVHLTHYSQQHCIFSSVSFPKSIKHISVISAVCKMLEAFFDAQIKIIQFCGKHTTYTFPTSD